MTMVLGTLTRRFLHATIDVSDPALGRSEKSALTTGCRRSHSRLFLLPHKWRERAALLCLCWMRHSTREIGP
jgi:hypothetical protein